MTEYLLVSLNDIEEKEASWLVPQRMPKGQIIILAGDGGSGKTSCWCSLAAAISTGAQVFFDETPKERRNIDGKKKENGQQGPCIENRRKSE